MNESAKHRLPRGKILLFVPAIVALTTSFSLAPAQASPVFFAGTGNSYEFISGNSSWTDAKTAAEALTLGEVQGHLVTILTSAENDFILSSLPTSTNTTWIGATDQAVEGDWRWVTGELFWSGGPTGQGGSAQNGLFEAWDPGDLPFGEPNDEFGAQNWAFIRGGNGLWSDSQDTTPNPTGYIVEFDNIPEPATLSLLAFGGLMLARRTRRRHAGYV